MVSLWRWRDEDPELRAALEQRQATDEALAEHNRQVKAKYGRGGAPMYGPEWLEGNRLEHAAWGAVQNVLTTREALKSKRRTEKDERSWDRFNRWTTAIDRTVEKYKLTRWSRMTDQERWDEYIGENTDRAESHTRVAQVAERFGLERVAAKARNEVRVREFMAWRADRCPNNPRNGGDGFGRGDREWTERRGDDWEYVEDYMARGMPKDNPRPDPLVADDDPDSSGSAYYAERIHHSELDDWKYPRDEDDFPLQHVTYLTHTLPDDTWDWGCGKSGCWHDYSNGPRPGYTTRAEALAAGREHEQQHGYAPRRTWDGSPETPAETRFFDLRESGFKGWIDQDGYAVACPSCGQADCTKSLTEHWQENNNGGSKMTAPTSTSPASAGGGDIQTIADLRREYERSMQKWAQVSEQHTSVAAELRNEAMAFEQAVGGMASEHDAQTKAEASQALEAVLAAVAKHEEAAAVAADTHGALSTAHQGLERHRNMEEAVASHPGVAKSTDAYQPQ